MARFIMEAYAKGYDVTFGEAWRPPETAKLYQQDGRGIANSLHCSRLAVDLNLFKGGSYLVSTEQWRECGELWESFSTKDYQCCWGGRFGDANHLSIEHGGFK